MFTSISNIKNLAEVLLKENKSGIKFTCESLRNNVYGDEPRVIDLCFFFSTNQSSNQSVSQSPHQSKISGPSTNTEAT